ncbi:MAG: alcohol dehydrogenase catalytic domain-containing protein [Hyphomicrobiaceae bacterium]|nr:alcohol dehydrogenase catalytic domain-containing protein [Hyphomicrobiaceae bacterium]
MQALVYTGPHRLEMRETPDPQPADGLAVVKVDAVGICGSDMHAYHGFDERRPPPLILGHEAAGRVLTGALEGARVTINPLVTCGRCAMCLDGRVHLCGQRQILSMPPRPGAFAELVAVPEANLVVVPDGLDIVRAALAEPLAVSYHAVSLGLERLRRPASSARCVVLGAGAIGLGAALVLAMSGAASIAIAEPNAGRRRTAEAAGGFACYGPGTGAEPAEGSVDLVIDAVGAAATRAAACRLARPGGVIVHVGLLPGADGLDVRRITLQEITFVGTYCYTPLDFRETVAAMAAGRLGTLDWLEERPLAQGQAACADIDAGRVDAAKVILRP